MTMTRYTQNSQSRFGTPLWPCEEICGTRNRHVFGLRYDHLKRYAELAVTFLDSAMIMWRDMRNSQSRVCTSQWPCEEICGTRSHVFAHPMTMRADTQKKYTQKSLPKFFSDTDLDLKNHSKIGQVSFTHLATNEKKFSCGATWGVPKLALICVSTPLPICVSKPFPHLRFEALSPSARRLIVWERRVTTAATSVQCAPQCLLCLWLALLMNNLFDE